jgi:hypothetical protein
VAAVTGWLEARGEEWKASVRVVAMDPCATYRRAISDALPQARIVAGFTDAHIHAVVDAAHYTDPRAAEYIALGPAACGFVGDVRYGNARALTRYCGALEDDAARDRAALELLDGLVHSTLRARRHGRCNGCGDHRVCGQQIDDRPRGRIGAWGSCRATTARTSSGRRARPRRRLGWRPN